MSESDRISLATIDQAELVRFAAVVQVVVEWYEGSPVQDRLTMGRLAHSMAAVVQDAKNGKEPFVRRSTALELLQAANSFNKVMDKREEEGFADTREVAEARQKMRTASKNIAAFLGAALETGGPPIVAVATTGPNFCHQCGGKLSLEMKFCPTCGTRISN